MEATTTAAGANEAHIESGYPEGYAGFIHSSRYARWDDEKGRRETWEETVSRYTNFIFNKVENRYAVEFDPQTKSRIHNAILNRKVLPSMRALMTAGEALDRDEVASFNCSYTPIDSVRTFDEILYILMCGSGVGYSVEKKYVDNLPPVPESLSKEGYITVEDSKVGWADALRQILDHLWNGKIPTVNTGEIRPAGSRLGVFGGRASGPEPFRKLVNFVIQTFRGAPRRQLTPLEVSDIVCQIGDAVVSGGVRRSALICLSDLDDEEVATSKHGKWWKDNPQRALANISAVYDGKPSKEVFDKEWKNLFESGSGERGIFNRKAAERQAEKTGRRSLEYDFGCNPCSEVLLRPKGLCNLSTIIVESTDTEDSLKDKVEIASIIGTLQSTLTHFRYLSDKWRENAEEERLLGVSMTGVFGNELLSGRDGHHVLQDTLSRLKDSVIQTNADYADFLEINRSVSTTCIKPEGSTSQLCGVSSGLHPWYSPYFIRTVRGSYTDPITQFMVDKGFPYETDLMSDTRAVFSFPVKAPPDAVFTSDISAIDHLELWKIYQDYWCEHKPSITINIKSDEWDEVGQWVYDNFDSVSGISFLPFNEHSYLQAPYQEVDKAEYERLMAMLPSNVDWSELGRYESEDNTEGSQTLACTGSSSCEIVDLA